MSLWGNKDTKTVAGTLAVTNNSAAVVGTSTAFTTGLKTGQSLVIAGVEYRIDSITDDTHLTLKSVYAGTTDSGLTVTANEQPAYIPVADLSSVYFVDATEASAGGDNVTSVSVGSGGTQYVETPIVLFSGGGGNSAAATATVVAGVVTAVTVTDVGTAYTSVPDVAIGNPTLTFAGSAFNVNDTITYAGNHLLITGDVVTHVPDGVGSKVHGDEITFAAAAVANATDTITSVAHPFITGDYVQYNKGAGGTVPTGLTDAAFYYVVKTGADTLKLATSYANATAAVPVVVNLTTDGVGLAMTLTYHFNAEQSYFVIKTGATTLKLARTAALATAGTAINITAAGSGTTYLLTLVGGAATATAALGSGAGGKPVTHSGWVKKTVGTGGRAGRVHYETLVAMGTPAATSGDAADDLVFPDA